MIKIRILKKATRSCWKQINYLASLMSLTSFSPRPLSFLEFQNMLKQRNVYVLAAGTEDGKRIVGMATLYTVILPTGSTAWLEDLIVDEPFRIWGVGRLLLEETVKLAKRKMVKHLNLRTNPKRSAAIRLYEEAGFKKMKTNFYRINFSL